MERGFNAIQETMSKLGPGNYGVVLNQPVEIGVRFGPEVEWLQ